MKKNLKKNTENTLVKVLSINNDGIFIAAFGKDYFVSFNRLPWFKDSKVNDIMNVRNIGTMGIRWDAIDVDLELESLIHPEKYPLIMKRSIGESI
jgi:hypothetical protein